MANTTTQPFYHQFEEAHRSESTKMGTAACRTNIIIHHKDTLDRPLPAGELWSKFMTKMVGFLTVKLIKMEIVTI